MPILREFDRRRHLAALDKFKAHLATDLPYEIRQRLTVIVGIYERLYVKPPATVYVDFPPGFTKDTMVPVTYRSSP